MTTAHDDIWAASDYAPTATRLRPVSTIVAADVSRRVPRGSTVVDIGSGHGDTAAALVDAGFDVIAVEPVKRMREVGVHTCPGARWMGSTGEGTGLEDASVDAVASSFGSMFCDPAAGPAEWARVLRPAGALVMTAWDDSGFLAEMTDRMMAALHPDLDVQPPHMEWTRPQVAADRLGPWFDEIVVTHRSLDWTFDSVDDGMSLYLDGSPTHAWSLRTAGNRRDALLDALRDHLESHADDGRIRSTAGYGVITARRRHD
ncbi:class I SAM-dependent methyltransferase [Acidipropionibacterium timonense]|uniref:class I SAM-dependent methyltransferase n=1 Tax=Acidipropionibacterium timonense TaxID=2161818 RepID=UPI0010303027|nr:class I SAM-dependent methyltransferase [Acidipropionibacterium timonense]